MRQSEAAVALIRRSARQPDSLARPVEPEVVAVITSSPDIEGTTRHFESAWCVRSPRSCISARAPTTGLRLSLPSISNSSTFPESAQSQTCYIMELFAVSLDEGAHPSVEADPANRWLTDAEIDSERTHDARAVSATMRRVLGKLRSEEKL